MNVTGGIRGDHTVHGAFLRKILVRALVSIPAMPGIP